MGELSEQEIETVNLKNNNPDDKMLSEVPMVEGENSARRVCDFVAGMTDRFAIQTYATLFMPTQWEGY